VAGFTTALGHRAFRRVWFAGIVDQTGTWLQITGRAWLIYHVTGSTTALGTIYFLSYLPQLLFSQFGGVVADRFDRRKVLLTGTTLSGLGAVAIGALAATDTASLANVGALSVVIGIVQTLTMPAQLALVPSLVPRADLASAVSLQSATQASTRVVGPLLAGALIPLVGVAWLFWLNAISFVAVIGVWWVTRVARQPAMQETRPFKAIAEGFRWVRVTPPARVLVITTLVAGGIGNTFQPLAVAFCTKILAHGDDHVGATYYGLFQAAIGVGAGFGVGYFTGVLRKAPRRAVVVASVGTGLAELALAGAHWVALAIAVAFAIGVFQVALTTLTLTLIQYLAPEELRGRVVSIHSIAWVGPLPIASLLAGWLGSTIGLPWTLAIFGGIPTLYCLTFVRSARHLPQRPLDAPDPETIQVIQGEEDGVVLL
jgi:MFS family permease